MTKAHRFSLPTISRKVTTSSQFPRTNQNTCQSSRDGSTCSKKQIFELHGRSLNLFGAENPLRIACFRLLTWPFFAPVITGAILVHWITLATQVWSTDLIDRASSVGQTWNDWLLLTVFILYTMEAALKIIAYGFLFDSAGSEERVARPSSPVVPIFNAPKDAVNPLTFVSKPETIVSEDGEVVVQTWFGDKSAYLAHRINRLDFIVVVCYWINMCISFTELNNFYLFLALSSLRPLRLLALTPDLASIMNSLQASGPMLKNVGIFLTFFYLMFSITGLQLYRGALSRRCALNIDNVTLAIPSKACGSYWSVDGSQLLPAPGNSVAKGYACQSGQICIVTPNPAFFALNYDNIFSSIFTVFVSSTEESWTNIMYDTIDAEGSAAALYYVVLVVLMALVMVQLFIAVIVETFAKIRADLKHSAFSHPDKKSTLLLRTDDAAKLSNPALPDLKFSRWGVCYHHKQMVQDSCSCSRCGQFCGNGFAWLHTVSNLVVHRDGVHHLLCMRMHLGIRCPSS